MDAAVVASVDLGLSYNTANIANWLSNLKVLKVTYQVGWYMCLAKSKAFLISSRCHQEIPISIELNFHWGFTSRPSII